MPLTSFSEPRGKGKGFQGFVPADEGSIFFAGIDTRNKIVARKVKDGEAIDDLYAFLTCPLNEDVSAVHPRAMPVMVIKPKE